MRKSYLLATVSIAALTCATPAVQARPYERMVAAWTGFYIGVHGGGVGHESTARDLDRFGDFITVPSLFPNSVTLSHAGGLAGGHIGYNWQSGHIVYGVEADFAGIFAEPAQRTFTAAALGVPEFVQVYSTEPRWLSTFRGRLGSDFNGTLVTVTAGLAVAGIRNRWGQGFADGSGEPAFAFQFVDNSTRLGWTAGAGIARRFTPHWSARADVLYVDLGRSKTVSHTFASSGGTDFGIFRSQWENTMIVGRAGVTYHWGAVPTR